jgi:FkbM family methyltransferase
MGRFNLPFRIARHEGLRPALSYVLKGQPTHDGDGRPDETAIVYAAIKDLPLPQTMIDVGAHLGHSLRPFLRAGWTVYAFEPDKNNRAMLESRLARYASLHIDGRALSNTQTHGAAFFSSRQSTGISGLSAFHDSHVMSDHVDVTTLAEVASKIPGLCDGVAFLKIDTEGLHRDARPQGNAPLAGSMSLLIYPGGF